MMKAWLFSGVCLVLSAAAGRSGAAAWTQAPGHTQVIVTLEPGAAKWAYDATGYKTISLNVWDQTDASVFIDYGLTQHLTVSTKVNFKDYRTDGSRFSGLGSLELGGRWAVHQGNDYVLALGGHIDGLGRARRNDFDTSGREGTDYDLRAYLGKSFNWLSHNTFLNIEAARHLRQYEASQWRLEGTLGVKSNQDRGMLMVQAFAGQTDRRAGFQSRWLNLEASLVRPLGASRLQLGVRKTIAGQNVPSVTALIVSLWRDF